MRRSSFETPPTSVWCASIGNMLINALFLASVLVRLCLLLYGEWQDRYFAVKFTDIDYYVFSDAAKLIVEGQSPYLRLTYRYTPILSLLLTLNHYLFYSFGKLLFIACDVLTGWLVYRILTLRGTPEYLKLISCSFWLLNPLTAAVSSRGNAESVLSFLVLLTLYFILRGKIFLSAVMYGLSVHMKIFPIMYSLPLFLFLDEHYTGTSPRSPLSWFLNPARIKFTCYSAATFVITTISCYLWCGWDFIDEAYLYHITRRDTRHNFSVYFYMLYLIQDSWLSLPIGIVSFLPQALLLLLSSLLLYRDIVFCCFVETLIFVTFNKVCTSQYFLWYLCLLPLILPFSRLHLRDAVIMATLWFFGQGLWLAPAYFLEFQGVNTFSLICVAGLVFFAINVYVLVKITSHHRFMPTFNNGHIKFLQRKPGH